MKVVAPGRVNIIGEHVDHQNYPVLPCAVEKNIEIEAEYAPAKQNGPLLTVCSRDESTYPPRVFQDVKDIVIGAHNWTNYVIAAYLGIVEYHAVKKDVSKVGSTIDPKNGLTKEQIQAAGDLSPTNYSIKLTVTGNIPPGAGLSSSSALVVCSAFAISLCAADGGAEPIDNHTMAGICTNAERYTGTAGGGMDQAAICLSQKGKAQLIKFHPLETVPVQLPKEVALVIANTCREAPKVRDAAKMYNKRVFELKTACVLILSKVNPQKANSLSGEDIIGLTLREVVRNEVKTTEEKFLSDLTNYIECRPYLKDDMDRILGPQRRDILLRKRCGEGVWTQNNEFLLFERIKHVLTETLRVNKFAEICNTQVDPSKDTDPKVLKELGELLNGSGKSLNEDYDCSCPEIEELCAIARKAGAYGSRLTGAGWGGCTVSLINKADTDKFLKTLEAEYFKPYMSGQKKANPPLEHLPKSESDISQALFVTLPGPAVYYKKD